MAYLWKLRDPEVPQRAPERAHFGDFVSENLYQNVRILSEFERPIYCVWDLESYVVNDRPEKSRRFLAPSSGTERVLNFPDKREKVAKSDFSRHGKYRAICKIFLQFRNVKASATGWLIDSSTVVTAGHNVYDWQDGYLISAKVIIGYSGTESEPGSEAEVCQGESVILPYTWIARRYEGYDVALIALKEGFKSHSSFKYTDTPETETALLGVVGYPDDLDGGKYMYESFTTTTYDLSMAGMMLSYSIDTNGGNSGSPVLRKSGDHLTAIGVHCYGGTTRNSGSVFGPYGNSLESLHEALRKRQSDATLPIHERPEAAPVRRFGFIEMSAPPPRNPTMKSYDITAYPVDIVPAGTDPQPVDAPSRVRNPADVYSMRTVFFINLCPDRNTEEGSSDIVVLEKKIKDFQGWAYQAANDYSAQRINGITSTDETATKSTLRAQAMDWIFKNRAPCLNRSKGYPWEGNGRCEGPRILGTILNLALNDPPVPNGLCKSMDDVSRSIEDSLLQDEWRRKSMYDAPRPIESQDVQFWFMLTLYEYSYGAARAIIRTVSFRIPGPDVKYLTGKGDTEGTTFHCLVRVDGYDFDNIQWDMSKKMISKELIDMGEVSIKDTQVSIDVLSVAGE